MKHFEFRPLNIGQYEISSEEPIGGSRPRIILRHKGTRQRFFLKTWSHNAREIWTEFFASKLGHAAGFRIQQVAMKKNLPREIFEREENTLPDDWIPIGALVSYAFNPREREIIYGNIILNSDEKLLNIEEIRDKIRERYYGSDDILEDFAAMIIFDAWIGNMDRHHGNWGIVEEKSPWHQQMVIDPGVLTDKRKFATLFDHGSSLLFEIDEATVSRHLQDTAGFEEKYIRGAKYSFFVGRDGEEKNIFELIAECLGQRNWRKYFLVAIKKIAEINDLDIAKIILQMPPTPEIEYSEDRKRLLFKSLAIRRKILLELPQVISVK